MFDINAIVNAEIEAAYLKGRRDMADEIKEIFLKRNPSNQYEIDMQMSDKLFEELNNIWCKWNEDLLGKESGNYMKIYVLLKQGYEGSETVCVSEDINKIRTSICEDFNPNEDYPELEIWKNGEEILKTSGSDVLKVIAKELAQ